MLGFDCGGQQWVLEVAFPTGTLKYAIMTDPHPASLYSVHGHGSLPSVLCTLPAVCTQGCTILNQLKLLRTLSRLSAPVSPCLHLVLYTQCSTLSAPPSVLSRHDSMGFPLFSLLLKISCWYWDFDDFNCSPERPQSSALCFLFTVLCPQSSVLHSLCSSLHLIAPCSSICNI